VHKKLVACNRKTDRCFAESLARPAVGVPESMGTAHLVRSRQKRICRRCAAATCPCARGGSCQVRGSLNTFGIRVPSSSASAATDERANLRKSKKTEVAFRTSSTHLLRCRDDRLPHRTSRAAMTHSPLGCPSSNQRFSSSPSSLTSLNKPNGGCSAIR